METLSLQKAPDTFEKPLEGALCGNVKVQFFEVTNREIEHFENVSNALIRLDQGTYGRCTDCGRRVEPDVLSETPWATQCVKCRDRESQP